MEYKIVKSVIEAQDNLKNELDETLNKLVVNLTN